MPIKEFYSPNYDVPDTQNVHADIRTTLYWNPLLKSDQNNKKISLQFYNNDITKSFRIVIEGMTKEELFTYIDIEFWIRNNRL